MLPTLIFPVFTTLAISVYIPIEGAKGDTLVFPLAVIIPPLFIVITPVGSLVPFVAASPIPPDTAVIFPVLLILLSTVGNNLGMYIEGAGTSSGKNTGSIVATTGTGVYVDGGGNSFDGTGGTITSNAVGIYLKNTDTNKITTGTLNIASGGVGVFGENAKIDFAVNVAGTGAVGVAAKSGSVIS